MPIKAPALPRVPWWLVQLAEKKLGKGAEVKHSDVGWIAVNVTAGGRTRVAASERDTLVWFLEQMPDKKI